MKPVVYGEAHDDVVEDLAMLSDKIIRLSVMKNLLREFDSIC